MHGTFHPLAPPDPATVIRRREGALRREARRQDLSAHKTRSDGTWYFADANNVLVGPEPLGASPLYGGMDLATAEQFLEAQARAERLRSTFESVTSREWLADSETNTSREWLAGERRSGKSTLLPDFSGSDWTELERVVGNLPRGHGDEGE
jgi:hypothetical protein